MMPFQKMERRNAMSPLSTEAFRIRVFSATYVESLQEGEALESIEDHNENNVTETSESQRSKQKRVRKCVRAPSA